MELREDTLKTQFNEFWNTALGTEAEGIDYYSRMDIRDFVGMKQAISNINNIVTLKTTLAFIEYLREQKIVSDMDASKMAEAVQETSANANGFDIEYDNKNGCRIIAEVKCNIPVSENAFGAAQLKGIKKDLEGLRNGKTKSGINDTSTYCRFMVLLDTGDSVHKAVNGLKSKSGVPAFEEFVPGKAIIPGITYIVYIPL